MERRSGDAAPFYGYIIVTVCFLLQAVGWGIFNSLGVFFKPLMAEFGWPRSLIAGSVSVGMLTAGISAMLLGRLSDRNGPRLTMGISGIFLGSGFMLMSAMTSLGHLYLCLGLLVGVGISGTDVILLSTTSRWFTRNRGMMIGVVKVGTGVGMVIMPLLITYFIQDFSWRRAFIFLGIICLISYVPGAWLLIRDPGKVRLTPGGIENGSGRHQPTVEEGLLLKSAMRTPQLRLIGGAFFIVLFCISTILMHIAPHLTDLGFSASDAARVLSTVGAMSIVGRLVMGGAGDRIGNRAALMITFGFMTTGMVLLLFAQALPMFYAFALVHGVAHGGFFALIAPITAEYFGTRDHGAILGIIIFMATIGGAVGQALAGLLFDVSGSYRVIFILLGSLAAVGGLAAYALKPVWITSGEHSMV